MEGGSILSMIAGFLPPTSGDPPQSPGSNSGHPPRAASGKTPPATGKRGEAHAGAGTGAGFNEVELGHRDVHMICFSKDRAFQLDQLLKSAERHLLLVERRGGGGCMDGRSSATPTVRLRVSVLYLATEAAGGDGSAAGATTMPSSSGEAGAPVDAPEAKAVASSSPSPAHGAQSRRRTMEESYALVRRRHPSVRFVRERPGEFCDQLRSLLGEDLDQGAEGREGEAGDSEERGAAFVLFAVDDMFFYRDFEVPGALSLLARDPSTFCVHLRLHPGITWSHTSGAPCNVPPLSPTCRKVVPPQRVLGRGGDGTGVTGSSGIEGGCRKSKGDEGSDNGSRRKAHEQRSVREETCAAGGGGGPRRQAVPGVAVADFGLLTFARGEGTGEWDYPWDLTGGLYRRQDAVAVVNGIISAYGKGGAGNPNLLEYHGDTLLRQQDLPPCSETQAPRGTATTTASASDRRNGPRASGQDSSHSSRPPKFDRHPSKTPAFDSSGTAFEIGTPMAGRSAGASPSVNALSPKTAVAAAAAVSAAVEAARAAPRCGCSGKAVFSSIAVNRVQSTYVTPVYASGQGGVEDLDRRLWASSTPHRGAVDHRENTPQSTAPPAPAPAAPASLAARAGSTTRRGQGPGKRECIGEDGAPGGDEPEARASAAAQRGRGRGGGNGGLDGGAYRRRMFNSVHVGELWFDEGAGGESASGREVSHSGELAASATGESDRGIIVGGRGGTDGETTSNSSSSSSSSSNRTNADALTVLLPVKDGGDLLLDAVESVIACAREMPPEWSVELLIVDDGSEDGAVERAVTAIAGGGSTTAATAATASGLGGGSGCGVPDHTCAGGGGDGDGAAKIKRCGANVEEEGTEAESGMARVDDDGDHGHTGGDSSASGSGASNACGPAGRGVCTPCGVSVRVLRHDRTLGLAKSLNEGLRESKSGLVARMDADDVCVPGRLRRQVFFMLENPRVAVLGTAVATFSGQSVRVGDGGNRGRRQYDREHNSREEHEHKQQEGTENKDQEGEEEDAQPGHVREAMVSVQLPTSGVQRVARHPTDPAFLEWSMLFSCCVTHPSVMLRRDRVLQAGGYDPGTEPAEDYDLWLRMEALVPGSVANLAEVLLGLRKHEANVSGTRRQEQSDAADAAAARAMGRLLDSRERCGEQGCGRGQPPFADAATVLRRPESAASASDLAVAARLLGDLGEAAAAVPRRENGEGVHTDDLQSGLQPKEKNRSSEDGVRSHGNGIDERGGDDQRRRGEEMVERDVEARLGAMAVLAMSRFGAGAAPVLEEYRRQFPRQPLLFALGGGSAR